MPGNTITLNGNIEWYVGDSKMPVFLKTMKEIGIKETKKK